MRIIGICGASCSGKTTLAEEIKKAFAGRCVVLSQDAYYRDHSDLPFEEREKVNYDAPFPKCDAINECPMKCLKEV